ncbi:hypothetical protein AVEN_150112-1 [Araneus ventricosus]|uniref:Uncharacterized protein n=1 Tax=Araneus ventricosus TaxID=182803 RepID=A0A4Y2LWC0_ARAVE|nr:hypothetical protein AVEN_150112-1 [Araneus ventricosus]
MNETNVRRDKSSEDDDNYEAPKMGTKELFIALERFKATSERFEEKMMEEDETHFSTIESFDSPAFRPNEGSSEDIQWEIIQVPYSTTNSLPNVTNFQNVPDAIADELDVNQLAADSIIQDPTQGISKIVDVSQ